MRLERRRPKLGNFSFVMNYDFNFFEQSIQRLRRLRSYSYDKSCLLKAPQRLFPDLDLGMSPRVLEGTRDDESQVILTRSYARKPGKGVHRVEAALQNTLPADFAEFHRLYDEALVLTRTFPIHLWNEAQMLQGIEHWRDDSDQPFRFFRFGQYWDHYGLWYGLWQRTPGTADWPVVIADSADRDQFYDAHVDDEYILAPSFHIWLKDLIARDGLPDPFMRIGAEGGFLDPA